ncbi:hypothetical protein HQ45_07170 [Porphyromonas crevioricanis]|uniref:Uncharacterized protein n=2 Tax=Porphyromonas crevioricanis TaxID=393921 RepID=A0AB34PF79_9PORP|nr:hypothetical protein [Porphyromonas crevioricanis]KGN89314.1 hypothetical protein HQ45_07170 [Porphyromonas crevioricanis]KGN93691.1 hypothetical protein HQ38_08610 [Porphyromonas crevioricanis]GAD06172.1 hypothetical protein PORCRE_1894 [Porphyromonas crevioricanis JCM 15906]SKA06705.1 hypothetical protein SAMN02745203_01767 [Porphyromonas crevioricanis]
MITIGMAANESRASIMRIYRQSMCHPETTNIKLLFSVIIERLVFEQLHEYRLLCSCEHFSFLGSGDEKLMIQ